MIYELILMPFECYLNSRFSNQKKCKTFPPLGLMKPYAKDTQGWESLLLNILPRYLTRKFWVDLKDEHTSYHKSLAPAHRVSSFSPNPIERILGVLCSCYIIIGQSQAPPDKRSEQVQNLRDVTRNFITGARLGKQNLLQRALEQVTLFPIDEAADLFCLTK